MDVLPELIGTSPAILTVKEKIGRLLQRQSERGRLPPLLIQGETGTGKGLLARGIHRAGPRAGGPFVDVNCAAIPETLLEAELFGFERGAFTDARQAKPGLFQTAHRGTIFLDEIGLLPEALQAKLLTVIEERAVRRLGSTRTEPVDVWLLAATNADLVRATQERRFREDLYHRLAVVTVALPPLRERTDDILPLAEHFLARACTDYELPAKTLAPDARTALLAHSWPGNIRELANVMERVALLAEARTVTAAMLGLAGAPAAERGEGAREAKAVPLEDAVGLVEREHLLAALRQTNWNITRAAKRLGISRDTLRYRIAKHGLGPEGPTRAGRRPAARAEPVKAPAEPAVLPSAGAPPVVRWERRRLALLRASLLLPADADPRLYPSRTLEVLGAKAQSFGGRVEDMSPTGVVAVFGLEPVEDAPRRAAHAAMAIQKAAQRARRDEVEWLPVKLAIHVDQFLVGQGAGAPQLDLDGKRQAWTLLEALVAGAEPDGIAVSEAAQPFLERHFELPPGSPLPGTQDRTYRLAGSERTGLGLGRRMATFVGRAEELELLESRLALALQGHGQMVGILGDAGIGKSRLIFECRRRILEDVRVTYLEGRCQSYGSAIPYLPILDILRQNFRIAELDSPQAIAEKVRLGLETLEMDPEEWAPYLLHLFGVKEGSERLTALSPGALKARTFEALRQMGLSGSRRRPIVFVLEDLHWIDATSEECFASLMESTVGAPVLLLATYRPGFRPSWVDKSYATQVALQPLSYQASLSVLLSVLETDQVPDPLARVILERAEGNPFFIEELSRAVGETGDLHPLMAIPETIQEVLMARVDRLPEEPKRLLQMAAVLGRQAPLPLLRALWEGPGDLEPHLRELTRLEFLYPASGGAEPVYAFVHTLTQEVAYESLPIARRQALHLAAGQAFEGTYAGRLEEVYDRLGYHYSRAGEADKAIDYLTRLAERAARGHAHTEAVRILEEVVGHVERLPAAVRDRRRLELALRQAYSLIPLGRFQEIVELLGGHQATLERLQDPSLAGPYHFLVGRSSLFLGDDARAIQSARQGIAEATRCGDEMTLGRIYYMLAQSSSLSGSPREGLEHGRRATALLERAGDQWWLGTAYWAVAVNHALMGEFDAALEAAARGRAISEATEDPQAQSSATWAIGVVHAARGEWEAGIEACRRGLDLAPDALNTALAAGWLGYAYLEKGDPTQAIPHLEHSVALLSRFRFPQLQGLFTVFLAEAHRLTGLTERARDLASQGLELAQASNATYGRACAARMLGRIARVDGHLADATWRLGEALRIFGEIEARYDAARTHLDLAAVAHARGQPDLVTHHLGEAHGIFRALRVPRYVERTEELAKEFAVSPPVGPVA
ncbi:MAG: sigma 54-interacting transcriptional regulator [Candidatus Rokubacteria bacterium]|nr:sigma 54-interacting transcriptional regulator [Candidatus Rokubacteria bacterium]